MTTTTSTQKSKGQLLLGLIIVFFIAVLFAVGQSLKERFKPDSIYFVIKPQISHETLTTIAKKLKDRGIQVTYHDMVFENNRLTSINVSIQVSVPGRSTTSFTLQENGKSHEFEPLIFYYEDGGQKVGFVKQTPDELSETGKKIVNENLIGLLIQQRDSKETIGSWHVD
ncbi:hypothetical protein QNI16_22690 [Cytophagaceae bacterium YF14B1]|uniref:Uncharacterized protein n=1 Tax=Xanthocytophaga flava TaxID=3048013 RepID=A0AAE3QV28_9BACT|nr:hypothetical protein [Xanthocytophaga flavus]MDJ1483324.1 hypothetical protein [Xanthocytophaga flavus]